MSSRPLDFDPIEEVRRQWVKHEWFDSADGMALVTSIIRAQQIFLARIDAELKAFDLTMARHELLTLLSFTHSGSLPMNKAGERLQVHPTSVTSTVDRLESQGFVERRPHPTDRRTTLVVILPAGRRVAQKAALALNAKVFSRVGVKKDEVGTLFELLRKIRLDAGDFEE
ncbi:MAG: MarR family winged helix-turn-helix transcriptional regulator [Acidimicrobiales bacterium]